MDSRTFVTIDSYDETVSAYEKEVRDSMLCHHTSNINLNNLEQVMENLKCDELEGFIEILPSNATILDLGCGPGYQATFLKLRGIFVIGLDLSTEMVNRAREIANEVGVIDYFFKKDIRKLNGTPNQSYDGMLGRLIYSHVPKRDLPHALKENHRVMKFGGVGYISVYEGHGERMVEDDRFFPPIKKFNSYFQSDELSEFVRSAGFKHLDMNVFDAGSNEYIKENELRLLFRK